MLIFILHENIIKNTTRRSTIAKAMSRTTTHSPRELPSNHDLQIAMQKCHSLTKLVVDGLFYRFIYLQQCLPKQVLDFCHSEPNSGFAPFCQFNFDNGRVFLSQIIKNTVDKCRITHITCAKFVLDSNFQGLPDFELIIFVFSDQVFDPFPKTD